MRKNYTLFNILAVMSAYVFGCGMMAINPVIQKLMEAYPEVPMATIKMVSTLPSLISSFVMILVGFVVGRHVRYKTILQISLICLLAGGVLPMFWNGSFWDILVARALFGLGLGGIGCRNALVIASFSEEEKGKYLGIGVATSNIAGVLMQIITGYIADLNLHDSFLIYLVAVIPLLCITFGLKEPESVTEGTQSNAAVKLEIRPRVWLYIFIGLTWCILGYSIMTNMSTFIQNRKLGTASVAGSILSLYVLGGAVGSSLSPRLYKKFGRFYVPMTFALVAMGEFLVLIGFNIPIIALGTAFAGFAWYALNPVLMGFVGTASGKVSTPFCTSIVLSATQIGVFLSSYLCAGLGKIFPDAIIATKYCAILCFALFAVAFLIFDIRPKQAQQS